MKTVEELEKEINNVEETLNNLKTKVEELKKSKNGFGPTPKDWKPKRGEKYWTAYYNLNPTVFICDEREISKNIIKYNRIFKTKEECQLYCDVQRAFMDASREYVLNKYNYVLRYAHEGGEVFITPYTNVQPTELFFDSEETVQNLIDKFGEENIKRYYLGVY